MDRKTEISKVAGELIALPCWEDINRIQRTYQAERIRLHQMFLDPLDRLFQEAQRAQAEGRKAPAAYLLITYLRSSFSARTYDFSIGLYDDKLYADQNCMGFYWSPTFIFDHADDILEKAAPMLKKKFVRLMDYEIEEYRPAFFDPYLAIARYFFQQAVSTIETLPGVKGLQKGEVFQIAYGEYMGPTMKFKTIAKKEAEV